MPYTLRGEGAGPRGSSATEASTKGSLELGSSERGRKKSVTCGGGRGGADDVENRTKMVVEGVKRGGYRGAGGGQLAPKTGVTPLEQHRELMAVLASSCSTCMTKATPSRPTLKAVRASLPPGHPVSPLSHPAGVVPPGCSPLRPLIGVVAARDTEETQVLTSLKKERLEGRGLRRRAAGG